MSVEVSIPADLWEGDSDAVITTWFVNDGTSVKAKQLLVEVMTEKIQHEIHSPGNGKITILKQVDEVVGKGDCIARVS
ncbi:MAG: pyruvate/2-oxoglutarate dehydrogenase complex dihydrolipoamide acyltransferase (E2) component [Paraglaciecola sp.]|jgi:pyruvate/2-oxoglutarate dehydrogenase complex dihydrolipoamide acyltransferase (E2) component